MEKDRARLPVIYSAHHAGHSFEHRGLSKYAALTPEQRIRFSDYGTADTVPKNGSITLINPHSRALGDLNRNPDDDKGFAKKDHGKPTPNNVWQDEYELSNEMKRNLRKELYEPYHLNILTQVRALEENGVVVAWDNTADYVIGKNQDGDDVHMPDIILSNRGAENKTEENGIEIPSCEPQLLEVYGFELQKELEKRGISVDIFYNLVYFGGYITRHYSTARNGDVLDTDKKIQSFQIEYNTKLTHDQETLTPYPKKIAAFREAAEEAMHNTL